MNVPDNNPYATPSVLPEATISKGVGELASLGDRLLGSIIDGLILVVPLFLLGLGWE